MKAGFFMSLIIKSAVDGMQHAVVGTKVDHMPPFVVMRGNLPVRLVAINIMVTFCQPGNGNRIGVHHITQSPGNGLLTNPYPHFCFLFFLFLSFLFLLFFIFPGGYCFAWSVW